MSYLEALVADTIDGLLAGSRRAAIWGDVADCVTVIGALERAGFLDKIACVVVPSNSSACAPFDIPLVKETDITNVDFDLLVVASDAAKEDVLRRFVALDMRMPRVIARGSGHYEFRDPLYGQTVISLPVKSKAGGYPQMLVHIYQCLRSIVRRRLQGSIAELGVLHGGTTVFMARALKAMEYPLPIIGFDTFAGFPPRRSVLDLFDDPAYSAADFDTVRAYCAPYPIELVRGDIAEVTRQRLRDTSLVLTFVDTDNYSAVRDVLPDVWENTVPGGFVAFDHYYSPSWDRTTGERMAADEVLGNRPDAFNLHATGIFTKLL